MSLRLELAAALLTPSFCTNMTQRNYDYMAHGGDSEFTLRRNREAFEWVDLVERPACLRMRSTRRPRSSASS
jgi:hypothetical protein